LPLHTIEKFLASSTFLWIIVLIEVLVTYSFFANAFRTTGWRRAFFLLTGFGWVVMIASTASFLLDKRGIFAQAASWAGMIVVVIGFTGMYFTKDAQPSAPTPSRAVGNIRKQKATEELAGTRRPKKKKKHRK
jgi:multidrug transporter EmrE-like cation transporter